MHRFESSNRIKLDNISINTTLIDKQPDRDDENGSEEDKIPGLTAIPRPLLPCPLSPHTATMVLEIAHRGDGDTCQDMRVWGQTRRQSTPWEGNLAYLG